MLLRFHSAAWLASLLIGSSGLTGWGPLPKASAQSVPEREAKAERLVGTWSLTDNSNILFNLLLRADGSSLTVVGQRHPNRGAPQALKRDQLVEQGRWRAWGNGIRSDYPSGWTDTIQIGPAGAEQWSWAPGSDLNQGPTNHGKAVKLTAPVMRWVGAYSLEPTQPDKPAYTAVLTSSGLAFNDIDHIADGSWFVRDDGSVMIKWTSGWRTALQSTPPTAGARFPVLHWRPGVPTAKPPSARRTGTRL